MNLVPGDDNGVMLKLNSPNIYVCADICGFTREASKNLSIKLS